jgi:uncharacterized protein with gpF-like domain
MASNLRIHLLLDRELRIFWRKMRRDVIKIMNDQWKEAASHVEQGNTSTSIQSSVEKYRADMERSFIKHYTAIAERYADYNERILGGKAVKAGQDTYWSALRGYIRNRTAQQIKRISDTTRKLIKSTIEKGMEQELTYAEMAKQIRKIGQISNRARATNIARTEAHSVQSHSINESVKSTGIRFKREWSSTLDERTRTSHEDADGQTVGMEEKFEVGGEELMYPGDSAGSPENVCRCRCVVLYRKSDLTEED